MSHQMITSLTQFTLCELDAPFHFEFDHSQTGTIILNVSILDNSKYVADLLEGRSVEDLIKRHVSPFLPIGVYFKLNVDTYNG